MYPNNGGYFDCEAYKWVKDGMDTPESFANEAVKWKKQGGDMIIGGCCQTHFKWIEELSKKLKSKAIFEFGQDYDKDSKASTCRSSIDVIESSKRFVGKKRSRSNKNESKINKFVTKMAKNK